MIQIIGIMIGAYIFTRMLEVFNNSIKWTRFFSVLTMLIVIIGIFILITSGNQTYNALVQ